MKRKTMLLTEMVLLSYWLCGCQLDSEPVNSISATVIPRGEAAYVAISGKGFSSITTDNKVTIGNNPARVLSATPDRLIVKVPLHLHGKVPVTVTVREQASNVAYLEYTAATLAAALRP